ncbi:MAG: exonuclease SbcCD subunit D [Actinomycetota bacterium]
MRFLHTADWHVGKAIRGRSRLEEFADALAEIAGIARDERVDAVLLAGDIYDQRLPVPGADHLVFEFFVRMHEAGVPVVAIPGNHDSADRLGALAQLLHPMGITVVHKPLRPDAGGIVRIQGRDGTEAEIACVPFVPERRYAEPAALFGSAGEWHQSYADGMGHLLGAYAAAMSPDRVRIVLAHVFAAGTRMGGGEREVTIGLNYAIAPARLPGTVNYLALGHVHRAQDVPGAPAHARYPGSILQLDFGDVGQAKSVTIVDAKPGTPAQVREVELSAGRRLIDIRGTFDEVAARAPEVAGAYVRAFVATDGPVPGMAERVREVIPGAVDVRLAYERVEGEAAHAGLSTLNPHEQFNAYYRQAHGSDPHPAVAEAFDEILAEMAGESL